MNSNEPRQSQHDLAQKNKTVAIRVFTIVFFMIGLSFASVPLYDLFCRVTGFGGTTQISENLPSADEIIYERTIKVRFNTDVDRALQWDFQAETRTVDIHPGQRGLVNYFVKNNMSTPVSGAAVYNVTPPRAGLYFHKVECFCFEEQTIGARERVNMPVMFYISPEIMDDRQMDDVSQITLSYTFFKSDTEALDNALEDFYNQGEI